MTFSKSTIYTLPKAVIVLICGNLRYQEVLPIIRCNKIFYRLKNDKDMQWIFRLSNIECLNKIIYRSLPSKLMIQCLDLANATNTLSIENKDINIDNKDIDIDNKDANIENNLDFIIDNINWKQLKSLRFNKSIINTSDKFTNFIMQVLENSLNKISINSNCIANLPRQISANKLTSLHLLGNPIDWLSVFRWNETKNLKRLHVSVDGLNLEAMHILSKFDLLTISLRSTNASVINNLKIIKFLEYINDGVTSIFILTSVNHANFCFKELEFQLKKFYRLTTLTLNCGITFENDIKNTALPRSLKYLYIPINRYSLSIVEHLANLQELVSSFKPHHRFAISDDEIKMLDTLPLLRKLSLWNADVRSICISNPFFKNLKLLRMQVRHYNVATVFENCVNLEILYLFVYGSHKLKSSDISKCTMNYLTNLDVYVASSQPDDLISNIFCNVSFPKLRQLGLRSNIFKSDSVIITSSFSNLESIKLDVKINELSQDILDALSRCTRLKKLSINAHPYSSRDIIEFLTKSTKLNYLHLKNIAEKFDRKGFDMWQRENFDRFINCKILIK